MYLQMTGEVSKLFLSAQPFKTKQKTKNKKKSESSQKRLKVFYVVIYCLVLYYIFTSNRRSLQKTHICAALQK